jgi:F0F1-type ATP synthase membrane subunit b/b'
MSETPVTPARPVSLFTIVFLFAVFAAFLLVIRYFYHPATVSAFSAAPDNITKELEWRANAASRRQTLKELHEKEAKQASSYGWVDQKAGIVQLPIDRAMELTARDLASKQEVRQIRDLPSDAARPKL